MDSFQLFENSRVFLRFFSEGKTKRILIFQSFSSRGKNFKDAKFERISSFYKLEWFSTTFRGESILDLQLFFSRGKDFPVARFFFFFLRTGQGWARSVTRAAKLFPREKSTCCYLERPSSNLNELPPARRFLFPSLLSSNRPDLATPIFNFDSLV